MQHTSWLTAGLALTALQVRAQDADTTSLLKRTQELIPVEIRAVRVNDKTPFAVSNLKEKDIRIQNLGQDIPYILNQTPSVVISSDAGAGIGYTGMRIRGTDASRINFTINGIPVNDAESQAAIFVDFPDLLSSTNSIQVQRGVGSSTNGAGAFGASVNLSNLSQPKEAYAEVNNSFGSFNTWKHTLRAGSGLLKSGFSFDVRASKITSDGYIDRASSDLKALQFTAGWQTKDERTRLRFNLFTGVEKTGQAWNGVPQDSLATTRRFNGLGLMADGRYYDDQTDNYQQDYYQLFLDHTFNESWSAHAALFLTRGKGFYNEYRMGEAFSDYGLPVFTSGADTFESTNLTRRLWLDNYYYGGIYSLVYEKDKTQFILGGAYTRYDGRHYGYVTWADYGVPVNYRWYNLDAFKGDFNIYAKLQQQIGTHWYVFGDLQYRHVQYEINGFRKNPTLMPRASYNFINPKAGLSYIARHANNAESKAYGSFAMANKEPNRDDFEASPAELPKHETLYDGELGYQYRSTLWEAGANLYYMYYRNQLIPTGKINDVGTATRTNAPRSYRAGIELTAAIRPAEWLQVQANATFSQNRILDFEEYIDDYDEGGQLKNVYAETDIAFAPSVIAGGTATVEPLRRQLGSSQHFFLDLIGKYVGRQYLDNTTNVNRSINPYGLCDLRLRYTVQTPVVKELGISLALNNVLNKKYEANGYTFSYIYGEQLTTENYYFPQAGFNFLLGLNLRF